MNRSPYIPFGNIATLHRGYDLPKAKRHEGPYPVISSAGITGANDEYKVSGKNVITGRYGTIGKVFYRDGPCWPLNTTLYVSDFKNNDEEYVAYLLKAAFSAMGIDGADKSTVPGIDRNVIHDIKVPFLSSRNEQRAVASVLALIDEAISTLDQQVSELGATGRLIYDYWFTQFDFPDENGRPYRASGGKMVWDDTAKREIPEGWGGGKLQDLAGYVTDSVNNSSLGVSNFISADNMIKNFGGIFNSSYLPEEGTSTAFCRGDTLFSNIRPYFKKVWLADRHGGCCADVLVLRANAHNAATYLYMTTTNKTFLTYVCQAVKGTKMPRGDKDHMMRYPVVLPPAKVLEDYQETMRPFIGMLSNASKQVIRLKNLRDWLLPMLMNGQVVIKNH